eukprot:362536-Chlamydomonas_euryale.AAC.1
MQITTRVNLFVALHASLRVLSTWFTAGLQVNHHAVCSVLKQALNFSRSSQLHFQPASNYSFSQIRAKKEESFNGKPGNGTIIQAVTASTTLPMKPTNRQKYQQQSMHDRRAKHCALMQN